MLYMQNVIIVIIKSIKLPLKFERLVKVNQSTMHIIHYKTYYYVQDVLLYNLLNKPTKYIVELKVDKLVVSIADLFTDIYNHNQFKFDCVTFYHILN